MSDQTITKEVFELHLQRIEDRLDSEKEANEQRHSDVVGLTTQLGEVALNLNEVVTQLKDVNKVNEEVTLYLPTIKWIHEFKQGWDAFKKKYVYPAVFIGLIVAILAGLGYDVTEIKKPAKQEQVKNASSN